MESLEDVSKFGFGSRFWIDLRSVIFYPIKGIDGTSYAVVYSVALPEAHKYRYKAAKYTNIQYI